MNQGQNELISSTSRDLGARLINSSSEDALDPDQKLPMLIRFKQYFLNEVQTTKRRVYFNGVVTPINNQNNLVKNTKYNIFTFIPKVLYNQFKFFFNLFFLVTALTQLVYVLKVGLFITFIGPLIMVLSLTMGKEAYDDYRTYIRDIQANSKQYEVIKENNIAKVKSKDLRVGDIVKIQGGDRIPADMVTLYCDNNQGTLFLKTDQLDGQTDWKLRKAIKVTQKQIKSPADYHKIFNPTYVCDVKPPEGQIYSFSGLFLHQDIAQKLTLENTLWASTVLTNGTILALVLYVGKQTRISLGSSSPRTKFGILDLEINFLSKLMFLIMLLFTTVYVLLQTTEWNYAAISFMRMMILLSSIIPISMRVNLDFAKLFYAYGINKDEHIPGTVTRNSNCPQQLGRVKYVLSDKTGTLTQNEMLFKQISIDDEVKFTYQQQNQITQILSDYENIKQGIKTKEKSLKDIITALVLCHNVTPVFSEDRTKKDFQASSPDQITFVKMAERFGLSIEERTQSTMEVKIPSGKIIKYEIKYTFPFKSETKRMGIILRNTETRQIDFYLKGADDIMKNFILNRQKKGFIEEQCKDLSMTGLRTLVITRKRLSQQFFTKWTQQYEKAYNKLQIDHKTIDRLMKELEQGVEFLGVTGIQDKLQDSLKSTIESLRSGGIKMWMVTGDKMETAECIGRSCGLQSTTEVNVKIQQANSLEKWSVLWQEVKSNLNRILIIDGKTLTFVLEDKQISSDFFKTAMAMPTVICCRCSPNQKKLLTEGVKAHKKPKEAVLGIGDGGNDVGMIQAADVGLGIVGKEGMQAALAADFSITEFKQIKTLIFWHGRLSYKRSALLASFIIHRGFIISVIQIIFSCMFYYVSIPVFNSYLQLGYSTFFTFWPVFALILDKDVNFYNALKYPRLYSSLQCENYLSKSNFFSWMFKASFQGTIIMILTLIIFTSETYLQFETVCFTILILTQYFMTISEINKVHIYMLYCIAGSIAFYIFCLLFFTDSIHIYDLTLRDLLYVALITAASWGPIHIWKIVRKRLFPTDYEKIMTTVKQKLIGNHLLGRSIFGQGERRTTSYLQ